MSEQSYDNQTIEQIWQMAKNDLESSLSPAIFNTWILPSPLTKIRIIDELKAEATINCMTAFHATNLKSNLYLPIKTALEKYVNKSLEINFIVGENKRAVKKDGGFIKTDQRFDQEKKQNLKDNNRFKENSAEPGLLSPTVDELFSYSNIKNNTVDRYLLRAKQIGLKSDFTFKNFAVDPSNQMAHAAATKVASSLGSSYNPLFLYGGVGVGKTHLMHAIANYVLKNEPDTNIVFCTGEEFTNEIIRSIQNKNSAQFRNKYRRAELLLLDDIQFIAGKKSVQEEFFHTFNALTANNSQVVLTSDLPPHEISLLEDRIRSRFEAGLMIDIQQPTLELRTAIFLLKAQSNHINIPNHLAQRIAAQVDSARRIEGIIKKIRSAVELQGAEISIELIDLILKKEIRQNHQKTLRVKPQDIIQSVSNHFHLKQSAIKGGRRNKELVRARHIAMFLLRQELNSSLEEIGQWFGGRDHTSVIHAVKKIEKELLVDEGIAQDVSALKMSLVAISR
ncbi:MAG: chromosomal replication initiator protein DnaA [Patescibacteria group bacterium]|jgi:chromosomal replication initiator protein